MSDSAIESASEDESPAIEWAPTSEEEDMPPDMEEEEGEEDEGEDEKEEADVDVVAESRQSVAAKFSKQELTIMMNAKPQWMSCRGAARKKVLETVLGQLYKLEGCKVLNDEAWSSRVQAYKTWFYNQCRSGANHSRIKVGRSWTARGVIQETHKVIINKVIRERYGKKPGTKEALSVYQKAVRRVVKNLTEEEWDEAENTAAKWNLDRGPPNEVKAGNAARYGEKVFRKFAQEMWRACGMWVVIMAGWKQEDGNTVNAIGDFNDEIADGEKFQGVQKISAAWDKYIGTHFKPEGEPNTDNADCEEESNPKQKQKRKRADPTTQVMHEDGAIWIGDLAGSTREGLQSLVRGFLTAHYPGVACAHPKAVAPFKKLPQFIDEMVASEHLPPDFQLSGDPSHMKTSEALQFLEFIQARQKEHPDDVFKFHHWIDENRDLQESMEDENNTKCRNEDSIEASSSTSRTEQPTRGKGKGKEKDKGKAPTENTGGVRDIGNMQPTAQVAAKNAGRPQPRQKGTTKPKAPAPLRQAIQSTAAIEISATSQPAKMPAKMRKDKCTSKKVDPVMVPVLGSKQESDTDNQKKSNYPSQRSGTPHPNNGSAMHQTSGATSSTPVDPPKNKVTGVETDELGIRRSSRPRRMPLLADADIETPEKKTLRKRQIHDPKLSPVKRQRK
ncbi:hypothetical protein PAXINDRAFT_16909 [Paxillus involutus ATCC 200175]|uniref:Uncharacterized protein n=1 Tax=Paxillus involutus ATCC 200175 TaxID=664439 RepID=A0A0C9TH07_PAXIN|nr:hypothetical protein PAXINDRAFT_16909 [Paxillus involutus ATCC 200175]